MEVPSDAPFCKIGRNTYGAFFILAPFPFDELPIHQKMRRLVLQKMMPAH